MTYYINACQFKNVKFTDNINGCILYLLPASSVE